MGSALNKGMPIYDQMSGPRVDPGRRPRKTRDFSATGPRRRLHLAFVCQRTFCDLLKLREGDTLTPDLVFRDPYLLEQKGVRS
jgi:hypothetical protein